jgi:REP element-mobilizing transposase RayT
MRHARIRGEGLSYYHCLSRVVDRRFVLGINEREHFVALMRKLEAFHGLRVVTYCILSNHFHLLVEEPDEAERDSIAADTVLQRIDILYGRSTVDAVRQELERARASGGERWEEEILDRYRTRMGDLSIFMKELKQRFTQWFNRRHGRRGTLWEERFKSMLVEGDEKALLTVAAYIDLNPVRARMVDRVEDYRWCGYASAVGGNRWAREGLGQILHHSPQVSGENFERDWASTAPVYRLWLYDQGEVREIPEEDEGEARATRLGGFTPEEVEAEIDLKGRLPLRQVIRRRVRYLSDGAVFGSASFVEEVFERERWRFGAKRKTGARSMREADWEGLCVLRDLRRQPVG